MSVPAVPPGLTCNQYYVYLVSGYVYSFEQGIMYLPSQVEFEQTSSTLQEIRLQKDETAHWLFNKYYYNLTIQEWAKATFSVPADAVDRIWNEAHMSSLTAVRLRQKNEEITNLMSSLQMTPIVPCDEEAMRPRQAHISSRLGGKRQKNGKMELNKVQAVESKHKSRRSQVKDKIRTLPPTLAVNSEFWKNVF